MKDASTLVDKARHCNGGLLLPVSDMLRRGTLNYFKSTLNDGVLSPYFQTKDTRKVGTGRNIRLFLEIMDFDIVELLIVAGTPEIAVALYDSSTSAFDSIQILPMTQADIKANGMYATIIAAINTYATNNSIIVGAVPSFGGVPAVGPLSYQTIVSQTGTAAPAVVSGFTPVSNYASGTTFTWARTAAGVYTLTASSAVFSTSGKTGVFVGGLNNLNAQWKATVTSSTVITFTFAVQSLAVLGLLGFTATNTDALLTNTMIYVQTYS